MEGLTFFVYFHVPAFKLSLFLLLFVKVRSLLFPLYSLLHLPIFPLIIHAL